MPLLKTASVGRTSITNIQSYLENHQRQEKERYQQEWQLYEQGAIQLSEQQVGYLKDYLGEQTRGLAVDVSEDLSVRNWARQMDVTYLLHSRNMALAKGKKSRTYYHYVLSLDPNDDCSLSTFRTYSKAWAEENFRSKGRTHEYAIVYHDDNTNGLLHAHIVVNATDRKSGRKLQLNNDEVVQLELSAQEIGKQYGLTPVREKMQATVGARTTQPVYLDRKEREILNKGGYSWKWELRKLISSVAPLSRDFNDFKQKLNRAGYDVNRSAKTGYLIYTHRNGLKVKDSRLGSRFYLESLEQVFSNEHLLADQTYSSWELIKISKGEIPWKEDIRRAIDAVAPTVVSIPELEHELQERYGIRLIVNRRGITYQHASGFKTRDVSIGFRYTFEGLRQNAVLGMALPYPGYDAIVQASSSFTRHYLPHSRLGVVRTAPEQAASHFIYGDLSKMMVRYGLVDINDLKEALDNHYAELKREKDEIVNLRNQVMRWNHLAALQTRRECDGVFLKEKKDGAEPSIYNDTLLRYERIGLYLREQAGGKDVKECQRSFSHMYERRLQIYQSSVEELNRDMSIYQNYLMAKNIRLLPCGVEEGTSIDAQSLFAAGRILSEHHVRDFFHLEQIMSSKETRLELLQFKLEKAGKRKKALQHIQDDIRTYIETKPYLPNSNALENETVSLDIEASVLRFREASRRLSEAGISEKSFSEQQQVYQEAVQEYGKLMVERDRLHALLDDLQDAKTVCLAVADAVKHPMERDLSEGKKTSSSGAGGGKQALLENRVAEKETEKQELRKDAVVIEDLPFEQARKRRQERLLHRPERSKRHREELER